VHGTIAISVLPSRRTHCLRDWINSHARQRGNNQSQSRARATNSREIFLEFFNRP
jgi:hypothetical protein